MHISIHDHEGTADVSWRLKQLNIPYWLLVLILISIDVLGPFATDAHLPSLPDIADDLDASASSVQLTVLLYALVMSFSSLFGGVISDEYGRRVSTIIGLVFFIIGNVGCVFSTTVFILNISRVVQAFGGGMSTIVTSAVARDVFEAQERLQLLGILGSIRPIAIAIAPMIGGYIGEQFGWRWVFAATAFVAGLVLIATIIKLPETRDRFFDFVGGSSGKHKHRLIKGKSKLDFNYRFSDDKNTTVPSGNSSANIGNSMGDVVKMSSPGYEVLSDMESDIGSGSVNRSVSLPAHGEAEEGEELFINGGGKNRCQMFIINFWDNWKMGCKDRVFLVLSIMSVCLFAGVAMYLNEFSFVLEDHYNKSTTESGILLGIGALFLIVGSFLATLCKKLNVLVIVRIGSILSLISSMFMLIPPIVEYLDNDNSSDSDNCDRLKGRNLFETNFGESIEYIGDCYREVMNDSSWYWVLIPFCIYTTGMGMFLPPAGVMRLEPYADKAAGMAGVGMFWMLAGSHSLIIVATQLLNEKQSKEPVVIHLTIFITGILTFVLAFCCIRQKTVDIRMQKR